MLMQPRPLSGYRLLLKPVCLLVGHREGWIPAAVPNPHALESYVSGCQRCGEVLRTGQRLNRIT